MSTSSTNPRLRREARPATAELEESNCAFQQAERTSTSANSPDPVEPEPEATDAGDDDPIGDAVRARHLIGGRGPYAKQHRLEVLQRCLLAGHSKAAIAAAFGVSVRSIFQWCHELSELNAETGRRRNEADPMEIIGEHIARFEEMERIGWQLAERRDEIGVVPLRNVVQGMKIVDRARSRIIALEVQAGYYTRPKMHPPTVDPRDPTVAAASKLTALLRSVFEGAVEEALEGENVEERARQAESWAEASDAAVRGAKREGS